VSGPTSVNIYLVSDITQLTVEYAGILVETLETAWVVCEYCAIGVIGKIFCELHEAFWVVEDTARESKAASRHRSESTSIIQRVVVAIDEPGSNLFFDV
jgi:hypothetical protein